MITTNLSTFKINKLTQAQYDTAVENGNIDENALYLTPEEDDINADSKNTWYGTCSTAASTTDKVVTTSTGDFSLTVGNIVYVLFTYASASSSTLNVDGTGAIIIKSAGTTNVTTYQWAANEAIGFVYDGTYFRMLDGMVASTTYYGMTKLSSSTSSTATNIAATPSAVKSAYDLANTASTNAATAQETANAALPKSGDTMTGALVAQNNTSYTTKQVRNIFLIADGEDLPSGSNGDICLVYTP